MLLEAMKVLVEAVRVLVEDMKVLVEAVRVLVEDMKVLVEAVRVLVEDMKVLVEAVSVRVGRVPCVRRSRVNAYKSCERDLEALRGLVETVGCF